MNLAVSISMEFAIESEKIYTKYIRLEKEEKKECIYAKQ